jgi:DNA-binding NtrC family response regulator
LGVATGDLLIVDDDPEILETLTEVLELEGHLVRTARNGQEGLRELSVRLPNLVLLDVEMPILDGPAMADRMFVDDCGRESIPIVLVTGVADVRRIAAIVGTPYVLEKPYPLERLLALIDRALLERTPPDRSHGVAAR